MHPFLCRAESGLPFLELRNPFSKMAVSRILFVCSYSFLSFALASNNLLSCYHFNVLICQNRKNPRLQSSHCDRKRLKQISLKVCTLICPNFSTKENSYDCFAFMFTLIQCLCIKKFVRRSKNIAHWLNLGLWLSDEIMSFYHCQSV